MSTRLYRLLLASGAVFAVSLALALADAFGWLVLPQPYRLIIPALLVASTLAGIVLLSGSIGIPKNPRLPVPDDAASGDAPEATSPPEAQSATRG